MPTRGATQPDAIGCVGLLMIGMFILIMAGTVLRGTDRGSDNPARAAAESAGNAQVITPVASDTATTSALAAVSPTSLPPVLTWTPSATPTTLPSPTASATHTPVPSATHTPPPPPPTATIGPTDAPEMAFIPTVTPVPTVLPTPSGTYSVTARVPILMYHYVSAPPEGSDIYRVDLSVTPEQFREQMAYLAANGYTTIDLYDLSLAVVGRATLPPKPVILTVDDGYRDAYDHAFPILKEFGLKATFFVITDLADQNHPAYLNWPMIEEMARAGMRMEPHTKDHAELHERDHDFLVWQILGSQQTMAAHIGYTPRYLAYPAGRYDDLTLEVVEALDFWGAVVTAGGVWHGFEDRYEWTRVRIRHSTDLADFARLLGQ